MNRIKTAVKCPDCGSRMDHTTSLSDPAHRPATGDISICLGCAGVMQFDENMGLVRASDEARRFAETDGPCRTAREIIKGRLRTAAGAGYASRCDRMVQEVRQWRRGNPTLRPVIQYNFTSSTFLVATLKGALEINLLSINEDARTMLASLGWLKDSPTMPTVFMVRSALERAFQ